MTDPKNFYASSIPLDRASEHSEDAAAADISIRCYIDEVPSFVDAELERLYGHIFSSLMHFRAYGGLPAQTSTYVVRKHGRIVTLFLFVLKGSKGSKGSRIQVINEGMTLDEEDIQRFADYVFATWPSVGMISFHAVHTVFRKLPLPYQRHVCTEDIVATVPASREAYLAGLGKSTRSFIHRYENKLRRTFPSFSIEVVERDAIEERHIRAIVEMNRARMAAKSKVSSNDDAEMSRITALAKECGLVCVAMIDGRICAGVINYRLGSRFFMPVIAHDSQYDDYRLGTICCFLTVCECIARGCAEYHFMWGRYEYKYRLGGVQRDLDHLAIYRSWFSLLRNADAALRVSFDGRNRQARQWLQDQLKRQGQGGIVPRAIFILANAARRLKR